MHCPFLREAHAKSCFASPYRKMILRPSERVIELERCSTRAYMTCPEAKANSAVEGERMECPFLQESLVQFCSASSSTTFVPYNESMLTRCRTNDHRYCDLYVSLEYPKVAHSEDKTAKIFPNLYYARNHLWMEEAEGDGSIHVGIDDFFLKVFRSIQCLHFVEAKGSCFPTVVVTVNGAEIQLRFPLSMNVSGINIGSRVSAQKLLQDSYRSTWLFEGTVPDRDTAVAWKREKETFLLHGEEAIRWMENEKRRLKKFIYHTIGEFHHPVSQVFGDDVDDTDIIGKPLPREEALLMYQEFFSPQALGVLS